MAQMPVPVPRSRTLPTSDPGYWAVQCRGDHQRSSETCSVDDLRSQRENRGVEMKLTQSLEFSGVIWNHVLYNTIRSESGGQDNSFRLTAILVLVVSPSVLNSVFTD